ncbi:MAG: hypothetical protein ACOH1T_11175 [Microbacteriaceae bacterium]
MPASTEPVYGIEYYGDTVRRHWRIVVIGVVVGALLAGVYLVARPPRVTATSDVSISAASTNPFDSSTNSLDPTTEKQLVLSQPVAEAVVKSMSGLSVEEVRRHVSVDAVSDTAIVHISFDGTSAENARGVADAVASAYLDYRAQRLTSRLDATLAGIDERAAELVTLLGGIDPGDDSAETAAHRAALDRELSGLATQRASFAQVDLSGGTLVTSADVNPTALSPNPLITVLAGLLAGAVIGMIAAFPARAAERRWKTIDDVERSTDADVLATVAETEVTVPASGVSAEVLLGVRERVLNRMPPLGRSIVVIDDAADPFGDVGANLAVGLAQSGATVELIVVGADPIVRDALTTHLAVARSQTSVRVSGLTVVFADDENFTTIVQGDRASDMRVVTVAAGAAESNLLAALRLSDAALLVGTLGVSTSPWARRVAAQAREFGALLLGTVLVPSSRTLGTPPAAPTSAATATATATARRSPRRPSSQSPSGS